MKWTPTLIARIATGRLRVLKQRRRRPQVIEYRGRHITVLFPSGMFETALDNGAGGFKFNRYDDLDMVKEAIDEDIKKENQ